MTQPRRVAVLATAKRVVYELGLRLGKEVGFQVRHDRRIGENCSIKFMTDGILLREVQVLPSFFASSAAHVNDLVWEKNVSLLLASFLWEKVSGNSV